MSVSADGKTGHIRLTSHPGSRRPARFPLHWGAPTAQERGPVVATVNARADRNAIGAHGGSYSIYRALAISSGAMDPNARPDLQDTSPVCEIGPHPQWGEAGKIVSLDPWGHRVAQDFGDLIAEGLDMRPSIAITRARLTLPE
ncbi:MAG: GTP cyclohydrolase II, partial [Gammaproteobacteria bacterium]